jgi:hypothetical protein
MIPTAHDVPLIPGCRSLALELNSPTISPVPEDKERLRKSQVVATRRQPSDTTRTEKSEPTGHTCIVMRITITCEQCGQRHRLARTITEPGPIYLVCHQCETPLNAILDETQVPTTPPRPPWLSGVTS